MHKKYNLMRNLEKYSWNKETWDLEHIPTLFLYWSCNILVHEAMNHLELDIFSFYYHHLLPLISRN